VGALGRTSIGSIASTGLASAELCSSVLLYYNSPCQTKGKRKERKASCTGVSSDRLSEQMHTVSSAHKHWNTIMMFSTLRQVNRGLKEKSAMGSLFGGGRDMVILRWFGIT
jgi:hypothetical protein